MHVLHGEGRNESNEKGGKCLPGQAATPVTAGGGGGKWVKCGRLIAPYPGKKLGEKRRKNMILLPCSLRVQGKKTMVSFQNGTVLRVFFCDNIFF